MAPEITSAIQTVPPSSTSTGFSRVNTSESQQASRNLRQAQKERQDARAEEQQAQKNLQAAQAEERRAEEKVNSAQAERQKAIRPTPTQTRGKIINVLI